MRFIHTNEPGEDDFSKRLCAIRGWKQYGAQEKAVEAARNALAMNLTAEQTAQITGLPLEQALDLQKELAPAQ